MVDSLQLQRTQVFQHLQHCTDFAEAIRFEFGIYAVITYTQTIVSLCISIDLPTAVSILYPQRSIYSKRLAEVFPSQGCSHVVPDAVQAIETLSTGQATVSVDEGLEFARDDKTGSRIAVIRTNPMASNSIPQYELLPGRRESSMHHLTLWEVKQLDVTDVVYGVSFDDDRAAAFVRNSPWSALGPNDALTDFDSVPELLLQVLHTFMRYENVQKVRLALVIGAFLAVLEWDRPAVVKCPSLLTVVLGRNPSLLCQYVPQKDYSPTILMPLRRMMKNGQPSPALRAALYYLYVQDVPMASIIPDADIFDIGYFAHNPYVDDEDSDEDNGNGGDEKIDDEENSGDKENSGGEENSGDEENSNDEENEEENDDEEMGDEGGNIGEENSGDEENSNEEENDDEEMGDEGGNVGEGGNIGEGGNVGDEYDTSYRRDVETLKRVFSDWWKTADIKITPEQDKMQLDQVSPEDMWDATYAPNQTPSTNALWG